MGWMIPAHFLWGICQKKAGADAPAFRKLCGVYSSTSSSADRLVMTSTSPASSSNSKASSSSSFSSAIHVIWTTESLEIVNTVTYGGVETVQYPLAIYRSWFRRFFTFVVPLACINYFPALAILDRADPYGGPAFMGWAAPAVGLGFLLVTLQIWQIGVRHYRSTGS